ncbi:MAG TPA: flagellar type III secretion system pore protein FliP [Longimicrobiales bacterium]
MIAGAVASALVALGTSLALFGAVMWVVRRVMGAGRGVRTAAPLEVLGRVAVGPRQGVTALRVGRRVVLVSVGEGGVRPLLELPEAEWSDAVAEAQGARAEFGVRLLRSLRAAASVIAAVLLVGGAAATLAARPALAAQPPAAQQPAAAPQAAAAQQPAAAPQAAAAQQPPAAPQAAAAARQQTGRVMVPPVSSRMPRLSLGLGDEDSGLQVSGTVGAVIVLGLLALLPTLLLLMTSFTRILIVLHLVRQALGTQTAPPGHLISALALLLTGFVMTPTLSEVNRTALAPWIEGAITEGEMLRAAAVPFRAFMLEHTREQDLMTFLELSGGQAPTSPEEIPLATLASAFVTSELRAAFQMGFVLFLPFIVIDLVVASVLMSLGMFMLPPAMISLPCKLLLFVLVDGWTLVVQSLAASFR